MASSNSLPAYQRIVTTHDAHGKAIIDKTIDTSPPVDTIPGGKMTFSLGYSTSSFPVNMNQGKDIGQYKELLSDPPGLVNYTGTVLRVVDFEPNCICPMHRTMSLDYAVVVIGQVELLLDSGETRPMKAGDVCIQRGTMHAWRNMSTTEWARVLFVLQPSLPIEVGGDKLEEDLAGMKGVRAST